MRKTTTRTLRILRAVLLLGLVGFIVLVVMLYRFGRSGMPTRAGESEAEEETAQEIAVMSGEGFDYLITEGERQLGRIRAARLVSQAEDEVTLEALNPLEVYRDDGDTYRIFSDIGTYNFTTRATTLRGNVRVEGPRGLQLFTEGLTMSRRERVTSESPVRFRMAGEFVGRARSLTANLNRELFTLSGRVEMTSTSPEREPVRLRTQRLTFERSEHLVRATGDVRFDRGGSHLSAPSMQFYLTEDETNLRYVSARKGITGLYLKLFGDVISRRQEFAADELALVLDPQNGEPVEAELRSLGGQARLWSTDETSQVRLLLAPVLHALFVDGEMSYAEAYGTVHLREYLAFAPQHILNWGCGDRAEVNFTPDGAIRDATFHERVEFRNRQGLARGDRIDMTGDPYEIAMIGEPARMIGAQAEFNAPRIVQRGEGGPIRALGGVRGVLDQGEGEATVSVGGATGPVRIESTRALWDREKQSFTFVEDVRLWQGESLLLAQEVETLADEDKVIARGGVKTVLVPGDEAPTAGEAAEQSEPGTGETPEEAAPAENTAPEATIEETTGTGEGEPGLSRDPIEVTSRWMEYSIENRRITYHDGVVITQIGRLMTCNTAEAQMFEGGGMEWLDCRGNAQVDDKLAGRKVSGEDAFFEVGRSEITFTGRPVVMTGDKGERAEGATLIYDLESGGARVAGPQSDPRPQPPDESGPG